MAEAFAKHLGKGVIEAESAGTLPAEDVHPVVVMAMRERGIDISTNKPKQLSPRMLKEADRIIVMGCGAEGVCPANLLDKVEDWDLEDPKGLPLEEVRVIRDQIECKVRKLIDESRINN